MKKLMIAAAIACIAAVSQAASVSWTTGKIYTGIADADVAGLKNGDVITAPTSGTKGYADGMTGWAWSYVLALTDTTAGTTETVSGTLGIKSHKGNTTVALDSFALPTEDGETKNYAWDIVITGDYTAGDGTTYKLTSNNITGNMDYTKLTGNILSSNSPATWTASVASMTPEPTSGLLLLLGFAGLALRRRRA